MKNKYVSIALLLAAGSIMFQCKTKKDIEPEIGIETPEKIDFDKAAVLLMDTVTKDLNGRWNLAKVEYDIKYPNPTGSVTKDTTFADFAVLDIKSVSRQESARYPVVKGEVLFQGRTYPVQFRLLSNAGRLVDKKGPQAFMLFEYAFPAGTIIWEKEDLFFRDSGLVGENYSIELDPKSRKMIWKGLNRDIKEITMQKL
ncbi:hypothetical protein [Dyadobacter pollutisoli]|jgi:hypothetical protein|uniref:Uncharacterized protein n=1 Tax=Dyadobacter pollutisoli TaxID=2910158 RepID=A0A9E8NAJ6_9BACT|nr:hypothetical protein [Dyadobacter pollutisoli]WAC11527.1 hypothetical protein ON006_27825 [Dyadobacter pollutisoli]